MATVTTSTLGKLATATATTGTLVKTEGSVAGAGRYVEVAKRNLGRAEAFIREWSQ